MVYPYPGRKRGRGFRVIKRYVRRRPNRYTRAGVLGRLGRRAGGYTAAGFLAYDALRAAGRAYRSRRKSYARRSGAGNKRSSQVAAQWAPGTTAPSPTRWKTLTSVSLVNLDRDTGMRDRLSGRVYVKGFKICGRIFSELTFPLEFHWGIIQEKSPNVSDNLTIDFFRSDATTTTRTLNFTDHATSPIYDVRYLCNPINTQRYNIITHKKFWLNESRADEPVRRGFKAVDQYFPIKRMVGFENDSFVSNNKPWYLVYWWLPVRPADMSASVLNVQTMWRTTTYFSDGRL